MISARTSLFIMAILAMMYFASCRNSEKIAQPVKIYEKGVSGQQALPHVLVYKTIKDYSMNVPVIMNSAKTKIISYPHPSDIYYKGKLSYPTPVSGGYLLDNRGINADVAFLDYTYEEYAALGHTPSVDSLMNRIIDRYPLIELWDCGNYDKYENLPADLDSLARKGFPGCKNIIIRIEAPR